LKSEDADPLLVDAARQNSAHLPVMGRDIGAIGGRRSRLLHDIDDGDVAEVERRTDRLRERPMPPSLTTSAAERV
jgi:hypothetical protein